MSKALVRITIIGATLYFLIAFVLAQYAAVDILLDFHIVPFEIVVVAYCYSESKYHCRHIKHLSVVIVLCDLLSRLDNHLDFLTVTQHNLIPISIISCAILVSFISAIRHFYIVKKIKNGRNKTIPNKKDGTNLA